MQQRPLLINGFMATGKSTLARRIAERTGHPYVDLDARLVRRTGMSIPDFFAARGETTFRELEQQELTRLLGNWKTEFAAAPVCALGGGTLVHRPTRLLALRASVVVTLSASLKTIVERARGQSDRPLLNTSDPEASAQALFEARRDSYLEANLVLDSDAAPLSELVERAISAWRSDSLSVAAGPRSYVVEVGEGRLQACLPALTQHASGLLLVSDRTVFDLYAERALSALGDRACASVVLAPGEQTKTLDGMRTIFDAALKHGIDRKGTLVALGGGVVTDMTGFAAATWLRGVRWVGVASTLLAMVDASVGGKTGVDLGPAKNSVGAFWQPSGVICDTSLIATESDRAYRGALAEVVKTAIIGDPELFELLESRVPAVLERQPEVLTHMVKRCVALKAWVVANDEREGGIRAWLNLGHTLGHALEAHGNYQRLTHGEAVSLGLVAALEIGRRLGHTPEELVTRTLHLLRQLGLPSDLSQQPLSEAAALLGHDKKRAGSKLNFVVPRAVGEVTLQPIELTELQTHTKRLEADLNA